MSEEVSILSTRAAVYNYNTTSKTWVSVDGGSSRVYIYHHPVANTYRVIGVSTKEENLFVLNTSIFKELVYQKISDLFLQWRDSTRIYGLSFATNAEADAFTNTLSSVVQKLRTPAVAAATIPPPQTNQQPTTTQSNTVESVQDDGAAPEVSSRRSRLHSHTYNARTSSDKDEKDSQNAPLPTESSTPSLTSSSSSSSKRSKSSKDKEGKEGKEGKDKEKRRDKKGSSRRKDLEISEEKDEETEDKPDNIETIPEETSDTKSVDSEKGKQEPPKQDPPKSEGSGTKTNHQNRGLVAKEILSTEESYVQGLTKLVERCIIPLNQKGKSVFNAEETKTIFSNIQTIKTLNDNFLSQLKASLANWNENSLLGTVFLNLLPFFKVYQEYINNYDNAIECLEKCKKRKAVDQWLKASEQALDGYAVNFFLITPVQRIPRYMLLLKELVKNTGEDHPDYKELKVALERVTEMTKETNEGVRSSENKRKLQALLSSKFLGLQEIVAPHRQFLHDSLITCRSQAKVYIQILIFTDLLVFASQQEKSEKKQVEEKIPLEAIWVISDSSDTRVEITTPDRTYLCDFKPPNEDVHPKKVFLDIINKALGAWLVSKGYTTREDALSERDMPYQFANGGKEYKGHWADSKPDGQGTCKYPNGNEYVGSWCEGRMEGKGKIRYPNKGYYEGTWKGDVPHEQGVLNWLQSTYKGEFSDGSKHGKGELNWHNGDSYIGDWSNDTMHGFGELQAGGGQLTYKGQFKNNKFHGKGILTSHYGTYDGEWIEDKKEGVGMMTFTNGSTYEGLWKDDRRHGKGLFVSGDQKLKYDGEWVDDVWDGKGTLTVQGDFVYVGDWKDNKRIGNGKQTWENGTTYDGEWKDDKQDGAGVLSVPGGSTYDGNWHGGKRMGKGKWVDSDGSRYDGEWFKDRKHGKGTFIYKDGSKYAGSWQYDQRHGEGVFQWPKDQGKYYGHWDHDQRSGQGTQDDKNGRYDGEWVRDKRHGRGTFTDSRESTVYEGFWKDDLKDGEGTLQFSDQSKIKVLYSMGKLMSKTWQDRPADLPLTFSMFKN